MVRTALVALVAVALVGASFADEASTIVAANSNTLKQYWSSTSASGGSWSGEAMTTNGFSGSILSLAACVRSDMMYVFAGTSTALYRKSYAMTASTGKLTETTTNWDTVTPSGADTFNAVFCVDDDLYAVDTDSDRVYVASDFTTSTITYDTDFSSSTVTKMTNPYGIFVSTTTSLVSDFYYATSGSGTAADNGVYDQRLTRTSSTGTFSAGNSDQWVASANAFELAIDTGGTTWFTTASTGSDIMRSTGGTSSTASSSFVTGSATSTGMRFSNQRLYFSSGSTVRFIANPVGTTTTAVASTTSIGTNTGALTAMAVYYAGSAVRPLPTLTVLVSALLAALLSRRFW